MLLTIVSYDGTAINDGTNFTAWFPGGMPTSPGADADYAPRSRTFPKLASKTIKETTMQFHIECKGTIHSQLETLKKLFRIEDYTMRVLLVKDTADSNREWYVKGFPIAPVTPAHEDGAGEYIITLAIDEPVWRTVTQISDSWAVTASGQTKNLSILGNLPARLKLSITPNTAKAGGYLYSQWLPWRNPLTVENGEPLDITNGGIDTSALLADDSNKCQLNGAINDSVTTIPYDTVTGSVPDAGMGYMDTEQITWTGKTGSTSGDLTGVTRGAGGSTAASHLDEAELKVSKILKNMNDLRVFVGATEIPCWKSAIGANTKIWVNLLFKPGISLTLLGAIADSGAVTTVSVAKTKANLASLSLLPYRFLFYIDSEVFVGYAPNTSTYSFSVSSRAAKGSSMAAHASGASITWIEHDINIVYGNLAASAPEVDDTTKPIFDLASSTNTSWVYTTLGDESDLRRGGAIDFTSSAGVGGNCGHYTGSHGADVTPYTELGMLFKSYDLNGIPKADTANLGWKFHHTAGFTTVTVTGAKYRKGTDWPTVGLWVYATVRNKKKKWVTISSYTFVEASPSAADSWEALASHSGVALGATYNDIYWSMAGSIAAGTLSTPNEVYAEIQGATLVINSSNVLQSVGLGGVEGSSYYLDATLTVVVSSVDGDAISLKHAMKASETLIVDCDLQEITHNGLLVNPIGFNSKRGTWLDAPTGSMTLRFDDTGTSSVTIAIAGEYRNTL